TLQVLEDFLDSFPGCLIIVSHDRYFMDRLIDHLFVFQGDGQIRDFPGTYSQYRIEAQAEDKRKAKEKMQSKPASDKQKKVKTQKKISYNEQREIKKIEQKLPKLEARKKELTQKLSNPDLPYEELQEASQQVGQVSGELEELEMRWLELEEIKG